MLKIQFPYRGQPENNDQWIHRSVLPFKKHGFYVELGAADGITGSSCFFLEQMGWQGICVEPSAVLFPKLCENRPKAICENVCVTDTNGIIHFHENGFLSRVVYRNQAKPNRTSTTLADLLRKNGTPKIINYLAMDCEGSDYRILRLFPFTEFCVLAISMEGQADDILLHNNFVKVRNPFNTTCPWESNYVHESIFAQ